MKTLFTPAALALALTLGAGLATAPRGSTGHTPESAAPADPGNPRGLEGIAAGGASSHTVLKTLFDGATAALSLKIGTALADEATPKTAPVDTTPDGAAAPLSQSPSKLALARTAMTDLHMIGDPNKAGGIVANFVGRYTALHKDKADAIKAAEPELDGLLRPKMEEADQKAVAIFAEAFTDDDLKTVVDFLSSQAGRHYVASIQPVMAKLRVNTGTTVGPAVKKMQERLDDIVGIRPTPGVLGELGRTEPVPSATVPTTPPRLVAPPATPAASPSATTPTNGAPTTK